MSLDKKEVIIKKIENLLALSKNNPSKHEAIAAALKAQELMAKYDVMPADMEQFGGEKIMLAIYEIRRDNRYAAEWEYILAEIIARNFCCETYGRGANSIVFYGYAKDVKIAREVFKYLYWNGNRLSEQYYKKCKIDNKDKEGLMYTYLCGFCDGIQEVLDKQCASLMLVVPRQVKDSFQEFSKGFNEVANILEMSGDENAYCVGKREGKDTVYARTIESQAS